MCLKIYYHYTDRGGLKGILRTQKIQKSKGGRYGCGVYLTKLHPENGRYRVAKNNWDGGWATAERGGKTNYAISVKLPSHRVERRCDDDDDTDIYVFDDHIYLPMTTYRLYSKHGTHEDVKREAEDILSTRKEMKRVRDSSNTLQRFFSKPGGPQARVGYAEQDDYYYDTREEEMERMRDSSNTLQRFFSKPGGPQARVGYAEQDDYYYDTREEEMERMRDSPKAFLRDPAFNMGGPRVKVGHWSPKKAEHNYTPREEIIQRMLRDSPYGYAPPTEPFFNMGGPRVDFGYGHRDLYRCGYSQ